MSMEDKFTQQELGYLFWPKPYSHSPGHPRLDINVSESPSNMHFDPEEVHLSVVSCSRRDYSRPIESLTIHHPWPHESECQVAAGTVIISDRKGKKVEAFTFGGILHIYPNKTFTECCIESDAPILELIEYNPIVMTLVEEVEIILAKRRAAWLMMKKDTRNVWRKFPHCRFMLFA